MSEETKVRTPPKRMPVEEAVPPEPTLAERYAAAARRLGELVDEARRARDQEAAFRAIAQARENDLAEHAKTVDELHKQIMGTARL